MSALEIPEDDLFWFDKGIVKGAADFTRYTNRLKAWFADRLPQ